MVMPGREGSDGDSYRYGFGGQEKDDEIKGEGNSVNYKYRMHDPRIGRFFSVDPLASKYPYYSVYSFSGNRVIDATELEGVEPAPAKENISFQAGVTNPVQSVSAGPGGFGISGTMGVGANNLNLRTGWAGSTLQSVDIVNATDFSSRNVSMSGSLDFSSVVPGATNRTFKNTRRRNRRRSKGKRKL